MATCSSILAWEIQRSLVGYSSWDHKELDTTETTHITDLQVVLVSGIQQSESAMCRHILTLFQVLFLYSPLLSVE